MTSTNFSGSADERWARIERIFDAASSLPAAEREHFLSRCGEEPEILSEVRELLASDLDATEQAFLTPLSPSGVLGGGGDRDSSGAVSNAAEAKGSAGGGDEPSDWRFGPYRPIREIGRGGMSVVYLAERVDGEFEQKVAIKVIAGEARRRAVERFNRERQILADLNHPNIARLVDGGTGESGEPYLAMEWIDGPTIDRHCREKQLSTEQRLALLSVVCEAVHAAHRLLVVHRDIKPSNVLVDRDGQVKLVDFGIAALLEGSERSKVALTRTGGTVLTPQYGSPEQFLGQPVGVATDIYQLGLLAYELLTDCRPYELAEVSPAEAMRLVVDTEPEPPSSVSLAKGSMSGRSRPATALDGEIDAVVSKALAKEPGRRYGSASLLRDDIERYLAGLPISARPPTFGYHLQKLIARHKLVFGLAASALILLVTMAGLFTWQLVVERDQTRAQAERAERLRHESEEVTGFLIDLFEVSDPNTSRGETITARELLDRGAAQLGDELETQPLVRARLLQTIATIYRRLGLFESAESFYAEAAALQETNDAGASELAASWRGQALVLDHLGRREEAEQRLQRALVLLGESGATESVDFAEALHHQATLILQEGQSQEALALLHRARGILQRAGGDPELFAQIFGSLGSALEFEGRLAEAEEAYARALTLREEVHAADDPRLVKSLGNIASLRASLGEYEAATPIFERIHRVLDQAYGSEHLETLTALANLGLVYMEVGRFEQAQAALDAVITALEGRAGPAHPMLVQVFNSRGSLALEIGRAGEAETFYRRSMAVAKATVGDEHPQVGTVLNNVGEALVAQGRPAEARHYFQQSLDLLEKSLGGEHISLSWPLLNLARLSAEEDPAAAGPLFRRAAEIRQILDAESEERLEAEEARDDFQREHEGGL